MAKSKKAKETDGAYLFKLVLYIIIGSQWLFLDTPHNGEIPLPLGVIIGAVFAMHEHFQIDRKIEYAVLILATFVGLYAHIGLTYLV